MITHSSLVSPESARPSSMFKVLGKKGHAFRNIGNNWIPNFKNRFASHTVPFFFHVSAVWAAIKLVKYSLNRHTDEWNSFSFLHDGKSVCCRRWGNQLHVGYASVVRTRYLQFSVTILRLILVKLDGLNGLYFDVIRPHDLQTHLDHYS